MRWRVGRSPTSRSMALTSCHGQPVRPPLRRLSRSGSLGALANTMVRDGVIRHWTALGYSQQSLHL